MRKLSVLKVVYYYFFAALILSVNLAYAENSEKKFSPYSPNEILIDSQAFYDNLKLIQGMFPKELKILAVMKSNAYGYGISNLANAAKEAGIQYYGVTENSEMLALRDKGITSTIMRLREATPSEIEDVLKNSDKYGEINEMVGNLALAEQMNEFAKEYDKVVPIHINLNSAGMGRNGVDLDSEKGKKELKEILALKNLKVVGIMSHFPNAGADDLSSSKASIEKFKSQTDWVIKEGGLNRDDLILHMAATSAALRMPESHFDMIRLGSLIYGEKTEKESPEGLKPLLSFKSHIAAKMPFSKGDTVGYGSLVTLERDSVLANIPFGKVNGVPYKLQEVLINGKRFKTIGAMSMNTTMVDITNYADDINVNDEVVIIGKQSGKLGSSEITLQEVIDNAGLTSLSMQSYALGNLNYLIRKEGKY
ncbi:alanine racemase [Pseudofrancisella aestuarii]|uniref:Alanine racemase n=1 Tax=Pseudofrancisella aestuarii TaxID=2670347 RepID=A0ABV9TB26_9GAMM|nr:alanine racemase [Pseudofrancisella aestuarii]